MQATLAISYYLKDTAIQRWDLVCSRRYVPRYIQSIFFIGNFFGALISGYIADTFGRRFCYCLFVTLWIFSGVLGSVTIDLYVWILTRFMCGAVSLGYYNVVSVYTTELTSGKWRTMQDYFFGANAWDFGIVLLGTLACFCRNMQLLEMIIALTNVPFLLAWLLLPESPRWLLSKGEKEQASKIMETICKINKRPREKVKEFMKTFEIDEEQQEGTISDLFRTPAVSVESLCQMI